MKKLPNFVKWLIIAVVLAAMAAMMVARNTPPHGIPVCDRICGLTMMIYDIAKNVVRPAMTSVDTVVPFSFRWKNFSIFSISISWVGRNVPAGARRVPARIATRLMESWDSKQGLTVTPE